MGKTTRESAFTLIELLVVISIIGLLASVILISMSSARAGARDARRKSDLKAVRDALELRFNDTANYPASAGWFSNPGHGGLDSALAGYIQRVPDDPGTLPAYMYWRKDYVGYVCLTNLGSDKFAIYARLERPSASDLATLTDSFDTCVRNTWGMNYKVGN